MAHTKANVLVIDSQPDDLHALTAILSSHGWKVSSAISSQLALETIQSHPPDIILLDIGMSDRHGFETCSMLKACQPTCEIPIIFVIALNSPADKARVFAAGGADYIAKPLQAEEVLARVGQQLMIQQQRTELLQLRRQVQHLNAGLKQQVNDRTQALQQALHFKETLRRIFGCMSSSLDQTQTLKSVVKELAEALEVHGCAVALYSRDQSVTPIYYHYIKRDKALPQLGSYTVDHPDIYEQLQQCYSVTFCPQQLAAPHSCLATLAVPMFDGQVEQHGILGIFWLFKPAYSSFNQAEIYLVEQVANQCALSLQQASLYEQAQAQVIELQRLNQLKNDFLSNLSYELRTPIANIKLVVQMLTLLTAGGENFMQMISDPTDQENKVVKYFTVLREECERELRLIEGLLNLQHLSAETHSFQSTNLNLHIWLPHLLEVFETRTQDQKYTLQLNLAPDLPNITTDASTFNRVVMELLNHALRYTPTGGTITVAANVASDELHLSITNAEMEIATEEIPHIFDAFYRIPNHVACEQGGTGLGLTLVHKLVERLGGAIEVKNEHQLTRFTVRLGLSPFDHDQAHKQVKQFS